MTQSGRLSAISSVAKTEKRSGLFYISAESRMLKADSWLLNTQYHYAIRKGGKDKLKVHGKLKPTQGLTYLEIIISIGIFVFVATTISVIFNSSITLYRTTHDKNEAAQQAQIAVDWMVREIQTASEIKEANSDSLTLINPNAEEINYYLAADQTIKRQVSIDPAYLLAEGIIEFNLNYYNINNQELSTPVTNTSLIKLVELELTAQKGEEEFQLNTVARCELKGGAWLSGYSYRKKITVQSTYIDSNLTDFPLYADITSDSDIGSRMQDTTNYYDIRFTDSDNNVLPYEEESMTISGGVANGNYWVKTNLDSSSGATLYCYYGKSGDTDGSNASGVWSANYVSVWHMGEASWNGTAGEVKDSLGAHNGTAVGGATTTASGKIGRGGTFDGTGDYVTVADHNDFTVGSGGLTLSVWAQPTSLPPASPNNRMWIITKAANNQNEWTFTINGETGGYGKYTWATLALISDSGGNERPSLTSAAAGTTVYLSAIQADNNPATDPSIYLDGALNNGTLLRSDLPSIGNGTEAVLIGYCGWTSENAWNGMLDEVRITNDVRTAAEIKFEYYNMNEPDNELEWATEEAK